jgi:hypothetical protein
VRRILLALAGVLWASIAMAQIRPVPSPSLYNPIFTGQWTVNLVACAAGQVVQGGSPTTCTANPLVGSLTANSAGGSFAAAVAPLITKATAVSQNVFLALDASANIRAQIYEGGTGSANFYLYDGSNNLFSSFGPSEGLVYGTTTSTAGFLQITRGAGGSNNQIQIYPYNGGYAGFASLATEGNYGWKFLTNETASVVQALTISAAGVVTPAVAYATAGSGMAVANVGANSCGMTAATIAGNNNAFVITVGTVAGTQCRVAFTVTAATEWDCTVTDSTTTIATRATPVDTTHTDFLGAFVAGDKVTGICFPR